MSTDRHYVDLLGFLGDVGPPMFDDRTKKNVRDSGVRLFGLTTTWPMLDWKATLQMHREVVESITQHDDTFHIVRCKADLQNVLERHKIGVILGMQDPGCIGIEFERIRQLYEEGIRVMQVAYQKKNPYGGGFLAESEDSGLTDTGRRLIETVNDSGMVLDLSHLASQTALDCIKLTTGPTIISHTVSRAVHNHPRGAIDAVLVKMAGLKNMLIGVLAMTFFLDSTVNGMDPFIGHIRYIADLVGPDNVAVGTDGPVGGFTDIDAARRIFDEQTQQLMDPDGLLKSRWPSHIPEIFENPQGFERICRALLPYFSREDIEGITGGNAWRFLTECLPTAS